MIADYYRERGWDEKGRRPKRNCGNWGCWDVGESSTAVGARPSWPPRPARACRRKGAGLRVSVSFLGILRDQIGQKSLQVDLPDGSNFGDLMVAIAPLMEEKVGAWAWDGNNQRFSGRIVVSRQKALGGTDAAAPLVDGEDLVVFPPLAGG